MLIVCYSVGIIIKPGLLISNNENNSKTLKVRFNFIFLIEKVVPKLPLINSAIWIRLKT